MCIRWRDKKQIEVFTKQHTICQYSCKYAECEIIGYTENMRYSKCTYVKGLISLVVGIFLFRHYLRSGETDALSKWKSITLDKNTLIKVSSVSTGCNPGM